MLHSSVDIGLLSCMALRCHSVVSEIDDGERIGFCSLSAQTSCVLSSVMTASFKVDFCLSSTKHGKTGTVTTSIAAQNWLSALSAELGLHF